MKQIYAKDSALIISDKEVIVLNHPTTIYTDDDVIVTTGKTETEAKETLSVGEIKKALTTVKIEYTAKENKAELIKKLSDKLNEKTPDITAVK